jgi:HSP20 family molecular chaperone IbpA
LRDQATNNYTRIQSDGEKRVEDLQREQGEEFQNTRERYRTTNEKMLRDYSGETQRVQTRGEQELQTRRQKSTETLKQEEIEFQEQQREQKHQQELQAKRANEEFRKRADAQSKEQERTINEARNDFGTRLSRQDESQRSTLNNNREQFLKALYKQNQKYNNKMSIAESRAEDPFYKMKSFDARLTENDGHYVLRAKVPAHDKDRVDIRVKDGKASITAARQHEEHTKSEGSQGSTSSYQTWRQEFTLPKPIVRDSVFKKVNDDGTIEVLIPKRPTEMPSSDLS